MRQFTKRTRAVVLAIACAPLLSPAAASADTTLALFEHDTVQNFVDKGDAGPGPGDEFLFAGDVFDRPGGALLGTTAGVCTTITGDQTSGQTTCTVTFNLAGGQVVVQGLADNGALFVRNEILPLAIVGGTGIYRNAGGDGTIQVIPGVADQADADFVLNVTG